MPQSLWNESDRERLAARLDRLRPDARPLWGKMSALQMITHLTDWMRMAAGELESVPKRRLMRYPGIRHFIIYWMPWPKGVPTAPELLARESSGWESEIAAFSARLRSFGELRTRTTWPVHPAFGKMSTSEWGVLGYRHTDHHLRQFGV